MTEPSPPPLVLASASPRRRELLEQAGQRFLVEPSDVDETLSLFESPFGAALELAQRKALAGAARHPERRACVLGADTIVAVRRDGRWLLLGKPADAREALGMLDLLSGTRHLVATGVAVVRTPDGAQRSAVEGTYVTMREILPAERAAYVASGEWEGKAGGYAIQETADRFVVRLEGGFDNVVGLPVALALSLYRELAGPQAPGGA
jgi:septum formation protein